MSRGNNEKILLDLNFQNFQSELFDLEYAGSIFLKKKGGV